MQRIPGLDGYYASKTGKIYLRKGLRFERVEESTSRTGYKIVSINGSNYRVNRLVLFAYKGPPPTPHHVSCHRNGKNLDNHPDNLYWGTQSENEVDKLHHGTHNVAKLNTKLVQKIRRLYKRGACTQEEIIIIMRRDHNIELKQNTISDIITRKTWQHVL